MASSINASTTAGLVNTADTSGVLQLQTAGVTAISIDASQAVSFTNSPTVTGGTANGVAYLNGSKVLTTGSALVFNGTNLILGDTTADGRLKVLETAAGAGVTFYNSANNSAGQIGTTNEAGVANSLEINAFRGSGRIVFKTNNTYAASFDASGNLLVGTTSGAQNRIVKSISGDYVLKVENSLSTNPYVLELVVPTASANDTSYVYWIARTAGGTNRAFIYGNGGLGNYSANNVNLSDRREKTNFAPAKSYLDVICAIPVQTFNYIDQNMEDDGGLTLGVVAQDVQAVAPELVMESNWGTKDEPKQRLSIYQTDLQYALMKCIQEQQTLITQLQADVAALKGA